ncbi:hypothetical protein R80B4_01521 [Fibrobacteres bacterium R8-0-B4]
MNVCRRGWLGVKRVMCVLFAMLFVVLASCATSRFGGTYTKPLNGNVKNAVLAVKDYETKGVIVVQTNEKHVGSEKGLRISGEKITYGKLMEEALKLNADDIINLRVDVTVQDGGYEGVSRVLIYTYTATALAIKYTKAVGADAGVKQYFKGMEAVQPAEN